MKLSDYNKIMNKMKILGYPVDEMTAEDTWLMLRAFSQEVDMERKVGSYYELPEDYEIDTSEIEDLECGWFFREVEREWKNY